MNYDAENITNYELIVPTYATTSYHMNKVPGELYPLMKTLKKKCIKYTLNYDSFVWRLKHQFAPDFY